MKPGIKKGITFLLSLIIWLLSISQQGTVNKKSIDLKQAAIAKLSGYIGLHRAIDETMTATIDILAGYLVKIADTTLKDIDRREAARSFFLGMMPVLHIDTTIKTGIQVDLNNIVNIVLRTNQGNLINNNEINYLPINKLGEVQVSGTGKKAVILISDIGADWEIYKPLMQLLGKDFIFYAITIPGCALTSPYDISFDGQTNPQKQVWLSSIENGLVNLILEKKMYKPIVLGTMGGGYFAAKLALDYADIIGKAVLLNALVNTPMRSTVNIMKKASYEERMQRLKAGMSFIKLYGDLLPHIAPDKSTITASMNNTFRTNPRILNNFLINVRDTAEAKNLSVKSGTTYTHARIQYSNEFATTDLTPALKKLKVPVLVIPSVHDDNSPYQGRTALAQWEEIKLLYPDIPLHIVPFYDVRSMAVIDNPAAIANALKAFAENKPIVATEKKINTSTLQSPRKNATVTLAGCTMQIDYGSPAVKGREIWGKLVPYDKLWRAGANEATVISFTKDVLIEGKLLKAGTYSIFAIPGKEKWVIIFNKVPDQWATTDYSSDFDALRVEATPVTNEFTETLSYLIIKKENKGAELSLCWEKIKVAVQIRIK